ncbi:hypothetical protein [Mythimna sequax nucleopolyhedrovirus]|nr:hypothetical protein [Mythimna sequax nucleopolyhedrovirus]
MFFESKDRIAHLIKVGFGESCFLKAKIKNKFYLKLEMKTLNIAEQTLMWLINKFNLCWNSKNMFFESKVCVTNNLR